jgi:hypothetical protein
LYHLRAAELWLRDGKTGYVPENFATAYAFALEAFSFGIRLATQSAWIQASLTQLLVGTMSLSLFVCSTVWFLPKRNDSLSWLFASIFALNGAFAFLAFLPKSDMLVLSLVTFVFASCLKNEKRAFVCGAACLYVLKPNMAPATILASAPFLIRKDFKTVFVAAAVSFLFAFPFLASNYLSTSNPFFPFATSLFPGAFDPKNLSLLVREAEVSTNGLQDHLKGVYNFAVYSPLHLIILFFSSLSAAIVFQKKKFEDKNSQISFSLLTMLTFGLAWFFFTQSMARPFLPEHSWRHFGVTVFCFGVVAIYGALLTYDYACKSSSNWMNVTLASRQYFRTFVLLACLVLLGIDLKPELALKSLVEVVRFETSYLAPPFQNQNFGIFESEWLARKPFVRVLRCLGQKENQHIKVFAFQSNQIFNTPNVTLYANSISYPMYTFDMDDTTGFSSSLANEDIGYIVLENEDPSNENKLHLAMTTYLKKTYQSEDIQGCGADLAKEFLVLRASPRN